MIGRWSVPWDRKSVLDDEEDTSRRRLWVEEAEEVANNKAEIKEVV
jgi:hypothetical protein